MGRPKLPTSKRKVSITVTLSQDALKKLNRLARGKTRSSIIESLLAGVHDPF